MDNNMNEGRLTKSQYRTLKSNLAELPELQQGAASYVTPGRSGSGSPSTERSIGFNVNALDYLINEHSNHTKLLIENDLNDFNK